MTLYLRLLTIIYLVLISISLISCRGTRSELNSFVSGSGGIKKLKVIPSRGSTVFTTEVTIIGSGFDAEGINVFVGDETCKNIEIVNDEQINCSINPQAAGSYDVIVSKANGAAEKVENGFSFINPVSPTGESPTLDSLSDSSGPAMVTKSLTLNGENFVDGSVVKFNTNLGTVYCSNVVVAADKNSLTCNTPVLTAQEAASVTGTSDVIIQTPDGQNDSLASSYTFIRPPIFNSIGVTGGVSAPPVDGVLNNNGSAIQLNINGNYFQDGLTVLINGKSADNCTYNSINQMSCSSLPDQGSTLTNIFSILITNPDGQSISDNIVLAGRPNITGITPNTADPNGGTTITFTGDNLTSNPGETDPNITFRNLANNSELGVCTVTATSPVECTTPDITNEQDVIIRFTNSFGYISDFSSYSAIEPAKLSISYLEIEDGEGSNERGKVSLGGTFTIATRLYNLSNSIAITSLAIDASSLATGFTYDSGNSTCTTTINTNSYCDLYFTYSSDSLNPVLDSGNVVVNYHDGNNSNSQNINFINTYTAPLKIMYKSRDFGDIPAGLNHNSKAARFTHVLQINNPSNNDININLANTGFSGSTFSFAGGSFPGTNASAKVQADQCASNGVIPKQTKCVLSIDFTPTSQASYSESLTITYNGSHTKIIAVTGESTSSTKSNCNPASSVSFGGGTGSAVDPFLICSLAHWEDFSDFTRAESAAPYSYVDKYYLQTGDIDLANPTDGEIKPPKMNAEDYGHFNGGGFKISNYSWQTVENFHGLFEGSGYFENIQGIDLDIIAQHQVGGLTSSGEVDIQNCYVTGDISGTNYVGGLVGFLSGNSGNSTSVHTDTVENSYFYGDIAATSYVGGLFGTLGGFPTANFNASYVLGNLNAYLYSGGIFGLVTGTGNRYW